MHKKRLQFSAHVSARQARFDSTARAPRNARLRVNNFRSSGGLAQRVRGRRGPMTGSGVIRPTRSQRATVVPAKAGTHNPREWLFQRKSSGSTPSQFSPRRMGPCFRREPGSTLTTISGRPTLTSPIIESGRDRSHCPPRPHGAGGLSPLISSSISRPAAIHGLLMSILCRGRNARISLPTSAARPRFTAHRCGRRNRSGPIRSRRFARRPCSIRRATTASGMRCSTRCGSSNAISGMRACWRHASFAREEIPLSLTGHFCRKPGQLWPMQQRSLSRTAFGS